MSHKLTKSYLDFQTQLKYSWGTKICILTQLSIGLTYDKEVTHGLKPI